MSEERRRPLKMFKVIQAHGPYQVGARIQPTGMYRDVLLKRGFIEEIKEEPAVVDLERAAAPTENRMLPQAGELALDTAAPAANRGKRTR